MFGRFRPVSEILLRQVARWSNFKGIADGVILEFTITAIEFDTAHAVIFGFHYVSYSNVAIEKPM